MHVKSDEYRSHKIFEELERHVNFYKHFSFHIASFMSLGTTSIMNIDTYVYSSMQGTLSSIRILLLDGRINDAYALVRKLHDSIIINIYTTIYLDDNQSIENFIVKQINDWISGDSQLPSIRSIKNYIKDAAKLKFLNLLINKDDRYAKIRDRGNDNTHYNFYRNVMLNDNNIYIEKRGAYLTLLSSDVSNLVIMHLAYIFFMCNHYMNSMEILEYFEEGITPPDNIEFEVAPFIQEVFNNLIKKHRPDIANLILANTTMFLY